MFEKFATKFKSTFNSIVSYTKLFQIDPEDNEDKIIKIPYPNSSIILVEVLEEIITLSEKIYFIPFPTPDKINILADFLNTNFASNYLIFNLSEYSYDNSFFKNQVVNYSYPGFPCPSLNSFFKLLLEMEKWIEHSPKNIVIIHCQGTRARSCLALSLYLSYSSYQFNHISEAFNYFVNISGIKKKRLLFPSQKRYLNYLGEILNGLLIKHNPLKLIKIVFNGIPNLSDTQNQKSTEVIFTPYIQIFAINEIIYDTSTLEKIPSFTNRESSFVFNFQITFVNDILIRCRHIVSNENHISVFRLFLNTNFVNNNIIRFCKKELDGAKDNPAFPEDFSIDLIFDKPDNLLLNESLEDFWREINIKCIEKAKTKNNKTKAEELNINIEENKNLFTIDSPNKNKENFSKNSQVQISTSQNKKDINSLPKQVLKSENNENEEKEEDFHNEEEIDQYIKTLENQEQNNQS